MKKALIIEDDRVVARIYQAKLQGIGLEVDTANDGETGLKRAEEWMPDIVVLDLGLPKLNGVEVIKRLRAGKGQTPIVVMSNSYVTDLVQSAWKAGATKCLTKTSCTPAQLAEIIQNVLNKPSDKPAEPAVTPTATMSASVADYSGATSQQKVRQTFLSEAPTWIGELRQRFQTFTRGGSQSLGELIELYRAVHSVTGQSSIAGFVDVAQLSSALEALLKELHEQPKKLGPSPIRSMASAIDSLAERINAAGISHSEDSLPPLILVVDDDRISRTMLGAALDRARLRHVLLGDVQAALACAGENAFDLIFTDVRMPGMTGFEFCSKLRVLPRHKSTPVIFVTSNDDFDARAQSKLSGGTDLIGKPFLMSELAVKALTYLNRPTT